MINFLCFFYCGKKLISEITLLLVTLCHTHNILYIFAIKGFYPEIFVYFTVLPILKTSYKNLLFSTGS